jgi:deazaflavin-dependent oxidoreductase (nitroreductase family)
MMGSILIGVGALLFVLLTVVVVFVLGMRAKSPRVLNAVRRFNHAVINRFQMRSAGTPGAYASVIRHRGRRSGTIYETPVGAVPTDDGFVIATVYGSNSDWLKNLLAAGGATIVHGGETYEVDRPRILPIEAAGSYFPAKDQRAHRRFRIDSCVRVRRMGIAASRAA